MKKIFLFFIASILLFSNENNVDVEKFFEKAFKQKKKEHNIYLPFKINGILHNEIFLKIDKKDDIFIKKETIEYVISLLKEKYRKKFLYKVDKNNFAQLQILNQLGIEANYSSKDVTIDVSIPPNLMKSHLLYFDKDKKVDINSSILPQRTSGAINLYLNQNFKDINNSNKLESMPLSISSDMFLHIDDFVLESRVRYKEEDTQFIRDRVALIKDDKENSLRYKLGDIYLPSYNRLSNLNSLGISIEKNFNFNQGLMKNVSRVSSYEFFLKNKSKVEIFINGRFYKKLKLEAGTHNLYNLNLNSGLNNIELKIIEESGKIEYLNFSDFQYSEILKEGIVRYGLGVGIISEFEDNKWIYHSNQKLLSSYIDYGLTDNLTIKSGLQFNNDYNAEALELFLGTNIGIFNPYIMISDTNNSLRGYKKGFYYRTNLDKININLNYEEYDKNYKTISNYNSDNQKKRTFYRGNLNIPFLNNYNIGISASRELTENSAKDKYGILLFSKISKNLNIRASYNKEEKRDETIYITLNYQFANSRTSYTNYIEKKTNQLDFNYNSEGKYGLDTNMQYKNSPNLDRYNIRAMIDDEKFKLNSSYNISNNKKSNKKSQSSGFQFSTGIVFAGDKATITSPITSSFVIVSSDDKLKKPLGISNYQESDDLIYDTFALQLSDYKETTLSVNEVDLDFGIDLINPKQTFITAYKSGSIMNIDVKNMFSITGKIVDMHQKAIANRAFKLFNTRTGTKVLGFTNDSGNFSVPEIEIGRYNATFMQRDGYDGVAKFSFEIKDSTENLINLGVIKVKLPPKTSKKKYLKLN